MPKQVKKTKVPAKRKLKPVEKMAAKAAGIGVTLTLSKYGWGMHYLDEVSVPEGVYAHPSFAESLVPFTQIADLFVQAGVPLGTKIVFTAKVAP